MASKKILQEGEVRIRPKVGLKYEHADHDAESKLHVRIRPKVGLKSSGTPVGGGRSFRQNQA